MSEPEYEATLEKELGRLEEDYEAQVESGGTVSLGVATNFAHRLIASTCAEDLERGVDILQGMEDAMGMESMDSESLLRLARGLFRLQRHSSARKYVDEVLMREPNYTDAIILKRMIDDSVRREGLNGVVLLGSWALFLVAAGITFTRWNKR
ncbi:uncharacterized protein AMSG_06092 [Thecamonas trahens ATCC 50062]|uniref:Mitochondrial fission 1 protein n=1 Tax=Thecamonas trahens ATCC 50062 TaxID=461836 RepID=A0A0L0DBU4_THETB|nr:hypothetical protein AMSG_06092 [Thecamonas trahens ATCC 50062]KNC49812.1 hypothetical protein AMSG_06092 [Thecamonas trahens ATCC 50062]|eukprot:XP_013757595.1 hypothetical protein AMSG_06092 [Thecamonas trahens ATCC 50062]